ncbi:MAG: NAD-dependent epimerase/dehydratase family protein [Proteobacteria bacterium]|nr:NAD-dependent epimerase/dehydratase family protein [Pseudomonadota bacterium]
MRVFVTGATGFIGRRLCEKLVAMGHRVYALVRKDNHGLPPSIFTQKGDLFDAKNLRRALSGCDRLYHLAALIQFNTSSSQALLRVNRDGTQAILTAARDVSVERTVVVSSASTVGISDRADMFLDENTDFENKWAVRNPYLQSKKEAESLTFQMAATGQAITVVNPTTVYGPGDYSLNSGTLIHAVAGARIVPIPPGGSNVVDVDDVVAGILAAGEHGRPGRRYILGGENLTFSRICKTIARVLDRHPVFLPIPMGLRKPSGAISAVTGQLTGSRFLTRQIVSDLFAFKFYNCERANSELGWVPHYTFEDSVKRAWNFYQKERIGFLKSGHVKVR